MLKCHSYCLSAHFSVLFLLYCLLAHQPLDSRTGTGRVVEQYTLGPRVNPKWLIVLDAGLPGLSWRKGCETSLLCLLAVGQSTTLHVVTC